VVYGRTNEHISNLGHCFVGFVNFSAKLSTRPSARSGKSTNVCFYALTIGFVYSFILLTLDHRDLFWPSLMWVCRYAIVGLSDTLLKEAMHLSAASTFAFRKRAALREISH